MHRKHMRVCTQGCEIQRKKTPVFARRHARIMVKTTVFARQDAGIIVKTMVVASGEARLLVKQRYLHPARRESM